jgi:PHP family Zn ribbon phosphoesterase
MTISDEIAGLSSGARFFRADLHIHSFRASHDVKDSAITPKGIVERAVADGLAIISVTDHNEITNVESAIAESKGKSLLVIPGVQLSTPQGHLLVYFAEPSDLKDFYGKLDFAGRGTADSRCQTAMLECLKLIDPSKGFAILAHVDDEGGLEKTIHGHPPHKGDILNQVSLLGIELRNVTAPISYSPADPDAQGQPSGKGGLLLSPWAQDNSWHA